MRFRSLRVGSVLLGERKSFPRMFFSKIWIPDGLFCQVYDMPQEKKFVRKRPPDEKNQEEEEADASSVAESVEPPGQRKFGKHQQGVKEGPEG